MIQKISAKVTVYVVFNHRTHNVVPKALVWVGINTVEDFYNAPVWKLKAAFHSVTSYYIEKS